MALTKEEIKWATMLALSTSPKVTPITGPVLALEAEPDEPVPDYDTDQEPI